MKITDILTEKTALENLAYKKKNAVDNNSIENLNQNTDQNDVFDSGKKVSADVSRINQLQKSFIKDNLSLSGLHELQNKIEIFENSFDKDSADYDQLTHDLNAIVNSTKYNGENIISYLSTNIQDNKSLYTFKSNLDASIVNTEAKLAEERKNLASYLVREENIETASSFSTERTIRDIAGSLNKSNIKNLYRDISNVSSLLGLEK